MRVLSLDFKDFRGFSYRLKFSKGITCLVGMNGIGKSTILHIIAALTGHRRSSFLVERQSLKYAKIVVEVENGGKKSLEIDGWDWDAIEDFKDSLPVLTSFVLQDELNDNQLVTAQREPVECQKDMLHKLWNLGIGFEKKNVVVEKQYATMLVGETGAQRYLLTVGMRRAPTETPMLIEYPERHVHITIRGLLPDFYKESDDQQIIMTSYCPEIVGSYYRPHPPMDSIIDLHSEKIKW